MIDAASPPTNIFIRPCGLVPLSICHLLVASSGLPEAAHETATCRRLRSPTGSTVLSADTILNRKVEGRTASAVGTR
jgi:hypothetical protein